MPSTQITRSAIHEIHNWFTGVSRTWKSVNSNNGTITLQWMHAQCDKSSKAITISSSDLQRTLRSRPMSVFIHRELNRQPTAHRGNLPTVCYAITITSSPTKATRSQQRNSEINFLPATSAIRITQSKVQIYSSSPICFSHNSTSRTGPKASGLSR